MAVGELEVQTSASAAAMAAAMAAAQTIRSEQQAEEAATLTKPTITKAKRPRLNRCAFGAAVLASTNCILLGYDIGVMSGALIYIQRHFKISVVENEVLVGILNICSLIGSLASGKTSDWLGRRYTIVLAACLFFIGALLMGFAPSYACLMAGRVVAGIGVGYSIMVAPVYVAELSPATTRGFLSALPEVFITFGILLGYISSFMLEGVAPHKNWRIMLALAAVPAVFIGLGVLFLPESPRWLVMNGRIEEAKRVLLKTSETEDEAELRLEEMTRASGVSAAPPVDPDVPSTSSAPNNFKGHGVWKELILKPSKPVRRILIAAIGINFFMQASGNDAVIYYCPAIFKAAGIKNNKTKFGVNIIMGFCKATFVLLSAFYLDRFGRRPFLLIGSIGMVVSLAALGLGSKFLEHPDHKPLWAMILSIVAVCADVSFFSIGLGPITWVYSSEIFPMKLRAQGSAIAVSVNRLVSGVVSMTFLSLGKAMTYGYMFFMYSGIMLVGTVFFYFNLPETKDKSLEDIGALFEHKDDDPKFPPAR